MTTRFATWIAAMTVIVVLALPGRASAQHPTAAHYPYILLDLGTFGGPQGFLDLPATPITANGIVVGTADTTIADGDYPNFNPYQGQDPSLEHAFAWRHGALSDLGALPGNNSSAIFELNARGVGAGFSETGAVDPVTGWPAENATVWQDGRIRTLGTLPGGYESFAIAINNRDQVAGFASNGIPDAFSMGGWGTQTRAFVWRDGAMRDLGTLGGPDSGGGLLNERGQVAGQSYTNATPNPATGAPTQDPFLWQDGRMQDLGSLGGTMGTANWLNAFGEVVGQSDLAGDRMAHPFLWDGRSLKDLGTLGGDFGSANDVSDYGPVVGWATTSGNATAHGVLWRRGVATDLGTVPGQPCSFADSVNARDQVVGGSCTGGGDGWLWERGSLASLDTLVAPSDLQAKEAVSINDLGEIVGFGVLPNGLQRVVLLVPARLAAEEGLTSNAPASGTVAPAVAPRTTAAQCASVPLWRIRLLHRPHPPCLDG